MITYERNLEHQLNKLFFRGKALIIIGARQVGKTTMLQNMIKKIEQSLWLNADENIVRYFGQALFKIV